MNIVESDSDEPPITDQNIPRMPLQRHKRSGITYLISKAMINHIDYIVWAIAIFDLMLCFAIIIFAVFMAIQQGKLLKVRMTPLMWVSLVMEILASVFMIGLLRYIVKKRFKLPAFTVYIALRFLVILVTKVLSVTNNVL